MKNNLIPFIVFGLMVFVSCKEETKGVYDPVNNTDTEYLTPEAETDQENIDKEENAEMNKKASGENPDKSVSSEKIKSTIISGLYIKVGEESDNNCGCYCLDINLNSGSEMCLVKDEMYVNTRFQKNNDNTINVFLVSPSTRNKQKDVPFESFDTDSPIATISPMSNGELKLDWLGFKTNGDLLTDYAIYGKKTLEGNYKKK